MAHRRQRFLHRALDNGGSRLKPLENLEIRIARLPHRVRVALVRTLLDRVIPVWEQNYPGNSAPLRAVAEPVWNFACGLSVDVKLLMRLETELSSVVPDMTDDPDHQAAAFAGVVGICALRSIPDTTGRDAKEAILSSISAFSTLATTDFEAIEEREEQWIEHALQVAEAWGGRSADESLLEAMKKG